MRVGVIGLGDMGRHHARVIRDLPGVREVIGCDLWAEARRQAARELKIRCLTDVDALLAERPDAVFVVTQPSAHKASIEPFLKAGIAVFTEKPIATTLADSRRLVELARRKRVPFQVGFELRCCGVTRAIKAVVKSGIVGNPLNMSLVQLSGPHGKGRFTKERIGGIFYEKLCHQIDYYRFWLGEPERVMAVAGPNALKHYSVPDNVTSSLVFPGGRNGSIFFLTTRAAQVGGTRDDGDRGHFYELTLTCTRGSLTYSPWTDLLSVVRFNHRKDCRNELVKRIKVGARYGEPVYDLPTQNGGFLRCVREGRPVKFPAADALKTMEWVARAEASLAAGGKWIGRSAIG